MRSLQLLYLLSLLAYTANQPILGYKYLLVPEHENLYTPCQEYPNNFVDLYADLSGLNFERLENYTILTKGVLRLKRPVPKDRDIPATMQLLKYVRGEWVNTIYNMRRNDLCTAIFSPTEYWHVYVKDVPRAMRVCPFRDDLEVHLDASSDLVLEGIPDKSLEGKYKLVIKAAYGLGPEEFVCLECIIDVYFV